MVDTTEEGGFSRSRRADDADHLTLSHRKVKTPDRGFFRTPVYFFQALYFDNRFHLATPARFVLVEQLNF
jgi:hypothetical protein